MPPSLARHLESARLLLRQATCADAEFILELVNEPAWKEFIADHGISTLEDAIEYIKDKLLAMYQATGFGLWVVEKKDEHRPIGLCGLIKRDSLEHIDLGFAILSKYRNQGFAYEASAICLEYACRELRTQTVLAIVAPSNTRSIRLLEKLKFRYNSEYLDPNSGAVLLLFKWHG